MDTRWSSYRWRNYDASMGRFFNVDPLAETYNTWSPYVFSGNRVVDARELEGLEPEDFRFRMYMKSKGGIQARAEEEHGKANSEAFMAVVKTVTPAEELYTIATGRDLDGNPADKTMAWKLLALNLVPQAKVEVKAGVTVLKAEAKAEAKAAAKAEAKAESKALSEIPKPPKGKGSVPPGERDKKRVWTKNERAKMLDNQNRLCPQCRQKKTVEEVDAHHIKQHADGGPTDMSNGAAVCKPCHKELHR